MHLSSYWGPKDSSGFQSRFCVCVSVQLNVCQVVRVNLWQTFFLPVVVCSACGHRPWCQIPQWQYNMCVYPSLQLFTGILMFLYLYSIVLIIEMITIYINITSVWFQVFDVFIPTLGYKGPHWGPVIIVVHRHFDVFVFVFNSINNRDDYYLY